MRLARAIALLVLLGMLLIGNFRQPVQAVSSCQDECANANVACNTLVDANYQTCMGDCDTLYPWWSGCQNYCFSNRESGWAQCESDYNTCYASCPP